MKISGVPLTALKIDALYSFVECLYESNPSVVLRPLVDARARLAEAEAALAEAQAAVDRARVGVIGAANRVTNTIQKTWTADEITAAEVAFREAYSK